MRREGGGGAEVNSTMPQGRTEERREGKEKGVSGVPQGPTDEERREEREGGGESEGIRIETESA